MGLDAYLRKGRKGSVHCPRRDRKGTGRLFWERNSVLAATKIAKRRTKFCFSVRKNHLLQAGGGAGGFLQT